MEETKPEKPKGLIGKLKDLGEEKEHQLEVLGTLVRKLQGDLSLHQSLLDQV